MSRNAWLVVLIVSVTLAIASIIPWMLNVPATPRPVARALAKPSVSSARVAKPRVLPVVAHAGQVQDVAVLEHEGGAEGAAEVHSALPSEDQELVRVAVRGGLIAAGIAALALTLGWVLLARGGSRRRAISLAGRGLGLADVARKTRMSQDAVRTLMVPEVGSRRGGVA